MRPPTEILAVSFAGRAATLTLRDDATILALGGSTVSSYDLSGRPYVLVRDESTFRRALDGRILEKRPGLDGEARVRRRLDSEESPAVLEPARHEAQELLYALAGAAGLRDEQRSEARQRLDAIVAMDAAALRADAERFRATYGRVGVLPPDQYLALVLQATQGCAWNACTFCDLYRGIPFHARTRAEFAEHIVAVGTFFGESLALRRSVFIGDANALCLPPDQLAPLLALAGRLRSAAGGLFAFVDMWTGHETGVEQYRDYARLGLRRVYVGLETGDAQLLEWLNKPGSPQQAVELVESLHGAGIAVGVIVLVGAGGQRFHEAHVRNTTETLTRMRLRQNDIVYFSELVESESASDGGRAAVAGLRPLDAATLREQRLAIATGFRAADSGRPPRRATYDLREFIY